MDFTAKKCLDCVASTYLSNFSCVPQCDSSGGHFAHEDTMSCQRKLLKFQNI